MESTQKILQRVSMIENLCSQAINLCYGIRKEVGDVDSPSPRKGKGAVRKMKAENLRTRSIVRTIQKKSTAV